LTRLASIRVHSWPACLMASVGAIPEATFSLLMVAMMS